MQVGVILFDFAPDFDFAGMTLRWETVALAATILLVVGLTALIAGRVSRHEPGRSERSTQQCASQRADRSGHALPGFADGGSNPDASAIPTGAKPGGRHGIGVTAKNLSRADLLIIAVSALPGAILGGRLGYVLVHLDYYAGHPAAIVDSGQGSLELGLATGGGTVTAVMVAGALRVPVQRWLHVAAVPVIMGLGLGKLGMALSGDGQGLPSDDAWATAYAGPGPWGSLAPQVPSHPAQLYEGGLTVLAALLLIGLFAAGRFKARDGRAFLAAIVLWAVVRVAVAFVWRDPVVLGPLRAGQLIALAIVVVGLLLLLAMPRLGGPPVEDADT